MSRLRKNPTLLTGLYNNTPFIYAHLVKFERPVKYKTTNLQVDRIGTKWDRYAYITDAAYDIDFDDGTTYDLNSYVSPLTNGTQTYTASKLISVGATTESTSIKVNSLSLQVDATAIDVSISDVVTITRSDVGSGVTARIRGTISLPGATTNEYTTNFSSKGFRVDDKIGFSNRDFILRVTGFSNNGNTMSWEHIEGGLTGSNSLPSNGGSQSFNTPELKVLNEESKFLITNSLDTSFVNRRVIVYKAFFYADNPHLMMGTPLKVFEGIITGGNYKESQTNAVMTWTVKSHWGDWEQKKGRQTSADTHQGIGADGFPNKRAALKPQYAYDYGFMHSEQSLSVIATYTDIVPEMKENKHKSWLGLVTKYKYDMIDVEVTRNTDLRFDLQARRLPVVYGVQRVQPIPVFADVSAETGKSNEVFLIHALCEGPIHSIMNIYVDDIPLVCVDAADAGARGVAGFEGDIRCVGNTANGKVLGGGADTSSSLIDWSQLSSTADIYSDYDGHESHPGNLGRVTSDVNEHTDETLSATFVAADLGITHERKLTFDTPIGWVLESHCGLSDQRASSLISTQANLSNKRFRIQQDYWTAGNSGIEYWGPNHRLLDTAYTALRFDLTADQTTAPKLEYIVKGKTIECYNYDGSYMHNTLPSYNSEDLDNFLEGTTVSIKAGRNFTASSDTGSYAGSKTANQELFQATIIEKFYWQDNLRATHKRVRWNLTGEQQDLLNEAKTFYMQDGSNTWNMITYDATVELDSLFTVAEIFSEEVTITSSGSNNIAATVNDGSANTSDFFAPGDFNSEAAFQFSDGQYDDLMNSHVYTSSRKTTYNTSNNTLTFDKTVSTSAAASTETKIVTVLNKFKLSSNASSVNDFYNGKYIQFRRFDSDGDSYRITRKVADYNGTTKVVTVTNGYSEEDMPTVGERVTINFAEEEGIARGQDVRPSINFATMLLDYLRSPIYGPGLLEDAIDLDSFRLAAQMCDTQSDVTIQFASSVTLTAGTVYRRYQNGHEKWRGTVLSSGSGTSHVFTNVTGKLASKFNNFAERKSGDLVYEGTSVYRIHSSDGTASGGNLQTIVQSSASDNAGTINAPTIDKVGSGAGPSTLTTIGHGTGNPVTNYSLYDSDDIKFWKYLGWEEQRQKYVTRHQGNVTIDTNNTVFGIIEGLLEHFNGQLAFVDGQYRLTVESTRLTEESDTNFTDTALLAGSGSPTVGDLDIRARYITDLDIIGDIQLKDQGLSKSYNSMTASLKDPQIHFDSRSVSFFDPVYKQQDRGIVKSTTFNAPGITNYHNAKMLVKQTLDRSRYNRQISFTMAPIGLSILPGELLRIEYPRFGWTSSAPKLFRVETVSMKKDCLIGITASEYNDSIYVISPPKESAFFAKRDAQAVAAAPSAPTNVSVTTGGDAGANLVRWSPSAGISDKVGYYEIWRAPSLSGDATISVAAHAKTPIGTVKHSAEHADNPTDKRPEFQDIGFTNSNNITYHYWVRAYNHLTVQTTSGRQTKNYYSAFNANSNYGDAVDAAAIGRTAGDGAQGDPGVSAITVTQQTYNTTVDCGTDGTPTLSSGVIPDSGNQIKVFEGTTALQYDGAGTSNGTWTVTASATNVTLPSSNHIVDSGSYASINPITGMTANLGTIVFSISGKNSLGTAFSFTATHAFNKRIPASAGKTVELSASKYVINYTKAGAESDSITLTATASGLDHITPHYQFFKKNVDGSFTLKQNSTSQTTYTIPDSDEPNAGNSVLYRVDIRSGSSTSTVALASDSVSIYGVQDGSDAVLAFLTNPGCTVPAASVADGAAVSSFANATGRVKVFVGGTDVSLENDVNYTFGNAVSTGTIAINSTNGNAGKGIYSVGALSANSGSVDFTVTIAAGSSLLGGTGAAQKTITLPFTLSKSITGAQGVSVTGADGLRTVQGYLFYEKTTSGDPPNPDTAVEYRFGTKDIAGGSGSDRVVALGSTGTNRWTNEPRTQSATSTNFFYSIRYSGTEPNTNPRGNVIPYANLSFSNPVTATNFDGVVTFSGGTFSSTSAGSTSNITTIDGSNITTGSLTSANHSGTGDGSGFSNAGTKFNLNDGTISAKQFRIDSSGNANFAGKLVVGSTSTAVSTVVAGAAAGATANQDDNATILSGNLTGQVGGTAANTVKTGAAAGATALQNGDTGVELSLDDGAVGPITIDPVGPKLYQGTGTFNNSNTGFYLDNTGKFSLKNKLNFDGDDLTITGGVTATSLTLNSTSQNQIANAMASTTSSSASGTASDSSSAVTLYNDNGVLKVRGNSLSGANHLVKESVITQRFSNDADFHMTSHSYRNYTECADLWWHLNTYGGPVDDNDIVIVRAGANAYISTDNGYTRSSSYLGICNFRVTCQTGSAQPETTAGYNMYGNKGNQRSTTADGLGNYWDDAGGRAIEAMRYESRKTSSSATAAADIVTAGNQYYKANYTTNTTTSTVSNHLTAMDKRVYLEGKSTHRVELVDSIRGPSSTDPSADGDSYHSSGGRYHGLQNGSNYAYFRMWMSVGYMPNSVGYRINLVDPYIEVTIIRNSNAQNAG